MRVKVLIRFRDIHTGELYNRGDVLTITPERYREITRVGPLVMKIAGNGPVTAANDEAVNTSNDAEKPAESPVAAANDGFDVMSVRELKEYADAVYKLTFKGGMKKAEIIRTLRQMEAAAKK